MGFLSSGERRAVFSLATILSLRMFGLFMVLPLFALYAAKLAGATPALIGLSMGVYGLTQALLQVPFGTLSDRFGRKKIITLGLCLFALGSLVAALSHTIWLMMLGRALQGAGAVGSTLIALIADLTSEESRTKAMAIVGMTIGLSFALSMMMGPLLGAWIEVNGIFLLAAFFSLVGIILLLTIVPTPTILPFKNTASGSFSSLFKNPDLNRLNVGIFFLHAIFTASFIVIPISLQINAGLPSKAQWQLFLPIVFLGFALSIPCIIVAEKKRLIPHFFKGAILLLGLGELLLWLFAKNILLSAFSILLFFTAFSLLEAFLPSLVSRTAPPARKGAALGIYSFAQFFGIFLGGTLGGLIYGALGLQVVYLLCLLFAVFWLAIAFSMKNPHYSKHLKI